MLEAPRNIQEYQKVSSNLHNVWLWLIQESAFYPYLQMSVSIAGRDTCPCGGCSKQQHGKFCHYDTVFQVCENDILLVDVVNRVPEQGFGIHWRGQPQKETPVMDGVPMVTQCPIPSSTTFQYKFRASRAGTHLWHAHAGTCSTLWLPFCMLSFVTCSGASSSYDVLYCA
jgi:hypothetical protein